MDNQAQSATYEIILKKTNKGIKTFSSVEIYEHTEYSIEFDDLEKVLKKMIVDKLISKNSSGDYDIVADIGVIRDYVTKKCLSQMNVEPKRCSREINSRTIIQSEWRPQTVENAQAKERAYERCAKVFADERRRRFRAKYKRDGFGKFDDLFDDDDKADDDNEDINGEEYFDGNIEESLDDMLDRLTKTPFDFSQLSKIKEDNKNKNKEAKSAADIAADKNKEREQRMKNFNDIIFGKQSDNHEPTNIDDRKKKIEMLNELLKEKSFDYKDEDAFEEICMDIIEIVVRLDKEQNRVEAAEVLKEMISTVPKTKECEQKLKVLERVAEEFKKASDEEYNLLREQIFDDDNQ